MKEKLWTKKYLLSVIILFAICLCSNIVLSVLTIFAKNLTGLDTYAGLMTSIFTLAALCVRFIAGILLDKFGCKKVILGGITLMMAAAFFFIDCKQIELAIIYRIMQGIGFGIASTGASTYVAKMCHPNRLLEGVSYASIANSLTGVVGPSIAYSILGANYDRFKLLFIVSLLICILTFGLMLLGKDVSIVSIENQNKEKETINWLILIVPILVLFFNSLTQSAITSFVSLYAISLGFAGAGMFFSVNAIGMISSRFIMNRLVIHFGEFKMLLLNSLLFFISVYLIGQVTRMYQLLFLALPAGFATGAVAPIVNTFLIKRMPESKNGIANATYYAAMDIGYAIGSVVWGIIAAFSGYRMIFYLGALMQIVGVILCLAQIKIYRLK